MGRVVFEKFDFEKIAGLISRAHFAYSTGWQAPINKIRERPERFYLWTKADNGWGLGFISRGPGHYHVGTLSLGYPGGNPKCWNLWVYKPELTDQIRKLAEALAEEFDVTIHVKVDPEGPSYQGGRYRLFGVEL